MARAPGLAAQKVSNIQLKKPIFVALDLDSDKEAFSLAEKLTDYVGGFKVGPRLTYKYGSAFVSQLAKFGPVFVDNKYHDIPSTVIAALKATFEAGAVFATVHASNGSECLKKLSLLEAELNHERPFHILAVTVLTSFNESHFPANWAHQSALQHVEALAQTVISSGLSGLVCSPDEVSYLREMFPQAFLVTPGIRLPSDGEDDQVRIMGPVEALNAGASALVIGRPIISAKDPVAAAKMFNDLIKK